MSKKREISEGKKNYSSALKEYDIQSAKDIQEALKDLLWEPFSMLEAD